MAGPVGVGVTGVNRDLTLGSSVSSDVTGDASFQAIFHRVTESAQMGSYIGSHRFQIVEATIMKAGADGKITFDQKKEFLNVLKRLKDALQESSQAHPQMHEPDGGGQGRAPITESGSPTSDTYALFTNFTLVQSERIGLHKLVADFDKAKSKDLFSYSQIMVFQSYVDARTDYVAMLEKLQAAILGTPVMIVPRLRVQTISLEEAPPTSDGTVPQRDVVSEVVAPEAGPGSTDTARPVDAVL
jgi:hypothetical protein